MLTRAGTVVLFAGLSLLTSGLALGNFYYATLALVPLGIFFAAFAIDAPAGVRVALRASTLTPRAGEAVLVEVDVEVARGMGAVEVHLPLPDTFRLVEGRNLRIFPKPRARPVRETFSFTIVGDARGTYALGPAKVERIHAALLRAPRLADAADPLTLEVRPRHPPVRRIRGLPGIARQMFPENDAAVQGIRTTEFREIREYHQGDTQKDVNWRATARLPGFHAGTTPPLVNEYDREGKKSVWLFLDAAPYMRVGTTLENSFEHAIGAATGIAQFYLDRGYKLGAYVYNADKSVFLYPDVGRRQMLRWQRAMTTLKPGNDDAEGLYQAIDRAHRFLLQERPLVAIVTRVGKADDRFFLGLRKLRSLTGRRRRRLPVLVVAPVPHAAMPGGAEYRRSVVDLLRRRERPLLQRVRRMGARVVEWDPSAAPLEAVLMRSARGGARGGAR